MAWQKVVLSIKNPSCGAASYAFLGNRTGERKLSPMWWAFCIKKIKIKMEKLKSIGSIVFGLMAMIAMISLAFTLIYGVTYVTVELNPLLEKIASILVFISILVLLPLAIFRKTRWISATGLYVSSYVFGLSTWMNGLLVTYTTLGTFWVIAGLLSMGGGIVPIGLIGSLLHGKWEMFGNLLCELFITFGARLLGMYLMQKIDKQRAEVEIHQIYNDGKHLLNVNADNREVAPQTFAEKQREHTRHLHGLAEQTRTSFQEAKMERDKGNIQKYQELLAKAADINSTAKVVMSRFESEHREELSVIRDSFDFKTTVSQEGDYDTHYAASALTPNPTVGGTAQTSNISPDEFRNY